MDMPPIPSEEEILQASSQFIAAGIPPEFGALGAAFGLILRDVAIAECPCEPCSRFREIITNMETMFNGHES